MLRAVSLVICDYFMSTGKQPLEAACITRWNHTFVANQRGHVKSSELGPYSVGLGAVRLMLYDC